MRKNQLLSSFLILGIFAGCNVNNPPDCLDGWERCIDNELSIGLYYICGGNGQWSAPTSCKSVCDGTICGEFVNSRSCNAEGERSCLEADGVNLLAYCHNNQQIVTTCMGACEDGYCINTENGCTVGDRQCVFIETLNLALEMECMDNQWLSTPCLNGVVCENDRCAPPPVIGCELADGGSCQGKETWAEATCMNGQCVPDKCRESYILSNGDCYKQSACCGDDCVDCSASGMICSSSGKCVANHSCPSPDVVCNGVCINPATSRDFCGADQNCEHYETCDNVSVCSYDAIQSKYGCVCDDAKCNSQSETSGCKAPNITCDGNCVDPQTDVSYCGAKEDCEGGNRGVSCIEGQSCKAGKCICDIGVLCGESCIDSQTSDKHCGCAEADMGIDCTALGHTVSGSCVTGKCQFECDDAWGNCNNDTSDGCETDLKNDSLNCGACGHACTEDNAICLNGECSTHYEICGDETADLNRDPHHCGSCDNECGSNSICEKGICVITHCDEYGYAEVNTVNTEGKKIKIKAYGIRTEAQLKELAAIVDNGAKYPVDNSDMAYVLLNDIEIDGSTWSPIGSAKSFTGYFLGNGKTISSTVPLQRGIFGSVKGTTIENLNLKFDISSKKSNTGGLALGSEGSVVQNVTYTGSIECGGSYTGAIFGRSNGDTFINVNVSVTFDFAVSGSNEYYGGIAGDSSAGNVKNCSTSVNFINSQNVKLDVQDIGGMFGYGSANIIDSHSIVHINIGSRLMSAGGLVGYMTRGEIRSSSSKGEIYMQDDDFGGLVGTLYKGTIENSEANYVIHNTNGSLGGSVPHLGGALSQIYEDGEVINTHVKLKLDGQYNSMGGGFVGAAYGGTIKNSSADADINCDMRCGGFAGFVNNDVKFSDCYSTGTVTGGSGIGGFTGFQMNSNDENMSVLYSNCASYTNLSGSDNIGGWIGVRQVPPNNIRIKNCYHVGSIACGSNCGGCIGIISSTNTSTTSNGTVDNYYAFSSITANNSFGGLLGSYPVSDETVFTNSYFYKSGCHDNTTCLTGFGGDERTTLDQIGNYTLDSNNELVFVGEATGNVTGKLINTLNATIREGDTKFVRAKCRIDIGEGEKDYILSIIPTVKPEFCTIL